MAATDYKDYYNILGVSKNASDAELKSAFRKLARKYHPDMNPGDSAAEAKFKEVNEAYEVLSDSSKRQKYDQFGQYWNQVGDARSATGMGDDAFGQYGSFYDFINDLLGRSGGSSGFPGNQNYSYRTSTSPSGVGFENMGGFGSMGNNTVNTDINADITLTFEDALNGVQKRLKIGSHETITVRIPAGAKPGSRIRVRGKGKPNPMTQIRGDLYLSVKLEPHPFFQFEGDRLLCELPITPDEAVLGAQIDVPTLEGTVKMNIPAGIKSGQSLRLRGKGWPLTKGGRTDLFFQVQIAVPKELSEVERECYERIATQRTFNPRAHIQGL